MNVTAARGLARRARRYGYHRTATTLYNRCPLCSAKVEEDYSLYAGTVTAQLDAAMIAHLLDDERCTGAPVPT